MQPEVISRDIIKPSSSTQNNHPKTHRLSIFDQIPPHVYVPLLFFYTSEKGVTDKQKSTLLKISLSTFLSHYYPLAGKVTNSFALDCNNDGVVFLEATMKCNLSQVLNNPQDEFLRLLLPENLYFQDSTPTGPVAVQVTYFTCGGMSIGSCLCHKVLDMSSMCSFINDWASLARNPNREICPEFNIGSLYPPVDMKFLKQKHLLPPEMKECVSRRLVFAGEKITKLKAMVALHVPNPTRVEVVTALLYKSVVKATAKVSSLKPSVMYHASNLRSMVVPSLSNSNIGNMGWIFSVSIREDRELELGYLVEEFRNSKNQLLKSCADREELRSLIVKGLEPESEYYNVEHEVYTCSSWCKFPFYEADFGWGKPSWVSTICWKLKNQVRLIDTREGDGIEAYISIENKVMDVFEQDEELLSFCSI